MILPLIYHYPNHSGFYTAMRKYFISRGITNERKISELTFRWRRKKRIPVVWIVEMWVGFKGTRGPWREGWAPTIGANIDFGIAQISLSAWRRKNPDDKFRLKKYRAV